MIKKISLQESERYIPLEENYIDNFDKAAFYTLVPVEDGWEKVKYFTSRSKNIYVNRDKEYDSWVYVLSNPSMPNLYKIGYTKLNPEERAKQLSSSTGVALPYEVVWAFHCFNGEQLEYEVHKSLNMFRVNDQREFFQAPLYEIQNTITHLGSRYI